MMSCLSVTSPVSPEKPRYVTEGIAILVSGALREKHSVQEPSDLYWRSSVRERSWK